VVDDKGCVAIGALGVPHYTYEDNCVRAVEVNNYKYKEKQMLTH
jgi:predicted urease superfamily metal-dependent hydrolase